VHQSLTFRLTLPKIENIKRTNSDQTGDLDMVKYASHILEGAAFAAIMLLIAISPGLLAS
jgi:hypothetical protein